MQRFSPTQTVITAHYGILFNVATTADISSVDEDNDGDHDFAGQSFIVTFTPTDTSPEGCTADRTMTLTVRARPDTNGRTLNISSTNLAPTPADSDVACEYDVGLPPTIFNGNFSLASSPAPTATVSSAAAALTFAYVAGDLEVSHAGTIDSLDTDGTPGHDFAGTTFDVSFAPRSGSPQGCSTGRTMTFTIGADGTLSAPQTLLITRPVGATADCTYNVNYPRTIAGGLFKLNSAPAPTASISPTAAALAFDYSNNSFKVESVGTVAGIDTDGTPGHDFAGSVLSVFFNPASGSPSGCPRGANVQTMRLTLGANGRFSAPQTLLVKTPSNSATECSYDVRLPSTFAVGNTQLSFTSFPPDSTAPIYTGPTASVSPPSDPATAAQVNFRYTPTGRTEIVPDITIEIPQYDRDDGTGNNWYQGAVIRLPFTRSAGPLSGCDEGATAEYTIQGDGTVSGKVVFADGSPERTRVWLTAQVPGETELCEYEVRVPQTLTSAQLPTPELITNHLENKMEPAWVLERQGGADWYPVSVEDNLVIDLLYFGQTKFNYDFTVVVADLDNDNNDIHDYAGVKFAVIIGFGKHSGPSSCNLHRHHMEDTTEYVIQNDGTAILETGDTHELHDPDTGRALGIITIGEEPPIDRPFGETSRCRYTYQFGGGGFLNDFQHLYDHIHTWPTGLDAVQVEETKINIVFDATTEEYPEFSFVFAGALEEGDPTVSFTPNITFVFPKYDKDDGSGDNFFHEPGRTGTIRVTFPRVDETNDDCRSTASRRFNEMFGGIGPNENLHIQDFEIRNNGSTGRSIEAEGLVGQLTAEDDDCEYTATAPATVSSLPATTPAWELRRVTNNTVIKSASPAVEFTYEGQTFFNPQLSIAVPYTDSSGSNVLDGQTITVTYTRVQGSNSGCTETASETYTVAAGGSTEDGGMVEGPTTAADLVDYPYGSSTNRCVYDLEFSASIGTGSNEVGLAFGNQETVANPIKPTARAEYGSETFFIPIVEPRLPDYDRDGEEGTTFFEGQTFQMTFTPSASTPNCSPEATPMYVILTDGSTRPVDSNFRLTAQPAGGAACSYDVTWPTDIDTAAGVSPGWELDLSTSPPPTATVTAAALSILATYEAATNFVPDVQVAVPQYDRSDQAGVNNFSGQTFTVEFAKAASADARCLPASDTAVYTIQDDGSAMLTSGLATPFVDIWRRAGKPVRCDYVATFESTVTSQTPPYTLELVGSTRSGSRGVRQTFSADASERTFDASMSLPANYVIEFIPNVTLDLPDYDRDGAAGTNFFEGEGIDIRFRRAGGPSSSDGCVGNGTSTYAISASGDSATRAENAARVPGFLAGANAQCDYRIEFPSTISTDDGVSPGWTLRRQSSPAPTSRASLDSPDLSVKYLAETTFIPSVSFDVPFLDTAAPMGENDLAGETIVVSYARVLVPQQLPECSPATTEVYTVGMGGDAAGGGEVSLTGEAAVLVDRPIGESVRCQYSVGYTDSFDLDDGTTYNFGSPDNVEIDATSSFAASYSLDTYFTPDLLVVPQYDRDGLAGVNYFVGGRLTLTFNQGTGADANCSPDGTQITFVVGVNGSVRGESSLVDMPDGTGTSCVYTTTFPASWSSPVGVSPAWTLQNQGTATADMISAAATTTARDYQADAISFIPSVSITVPPLEGVPTGPTSFSNLFAGAQFTVSFADGSGHADCNSGIAAVVYTVQDSGIATLTSGTLPTLVDRPARQEARCSYGVTVGPAELSSSDLTPPPTDADPRWALTREAGHTTSVGEGDFGISAQYVRQAGEPITFVPNVAIVVPPFNVDDDPATDGTDESVPVRNWFVGERFVVEFDQATGASPRCTDSNTRFTFEVQANGSVTVASAPGAPGSSAPGAPGSSAPGAPAFELVDYPARESARCSYVVSYPANELDLATAPVFVLDLVTAGPNAPDTSTSAAARETGATYAHRQISFAPVVDIAAPFLDEVAPSGDNDLSGQTITVRYAPVSAPDQNAACSGFGSAADPTETYTIGTGGSISGGGTVSLTGPAASLVDRPAGVNERCRYDATFPNPLTLGSADYTLTTSGSVEFEADAKAVAAYAGETTFFPDITLTVPQYNADDNPATTADESANNWFVGTEIAVTFNRASGANANCSPDGTRIVYVVSGTGSVARAADAQELIDVPNGQTASCSYDAAFEASVSSGTVVVPAWTLRNQGAAAATGITAGGTAVSRSYLADAISFTPTVDIGVPQLDLRANANLFAGAQFTITFANGSGHADCTSGTTNAATLTYTLQASGDTMLTSGAVPTLLDRAARQDARCSYVVAVGPQELASTAVSPVPSATDLVWALTRDAGHTTSVGSGALAVAAAYSLKAGTHVTYGADVTISVPQYNADDDPSTMAVESDRNWFAGESFDVTFARTAGPAAGASGCTPSRTLSYTVAANGAVATSGDLDFVDYPNGETDRCVYGVTYPASVPSSQSGAGQGGAPLVRQAAGLDAAFAGDSQTTAATYHAQPAFSPPVAVVVPFIDDAAPFGQNDLAGTPIVVAYRPVSGSNAGCTGAASPGTSDDASDTYTIAAGGSDTDGGVATPPASPAVLVDRPAGETGRCRYQAVSPAEIGSAAVGTFELVSANMVEFGALDELAVTYSGNTFFSVDLTIDVPQFERDGMPGTNFFEGARFEISFAPVSGSVAGCSEAGSEFYVVRAGGLVEPADGKFSLIDVPDEQTASCSYDLTLPASLSSLPDAVAVWELTQPADTAITTTVVNTNNSSLRLIYQSGTSSFVPTVAIEVPQLDGAATGGGAAPGAGGGAATFSNVFAGATFGVTLSQRTGFGLPDSGCSLPRPQTFTFTVGANGQVTTPGSSPGSGSGATLPPLVNRPAGSDVGCEYGVQFPATVSPPTSLPPTASFIWQLRAPSNAGTLLSGTFPTVSAAYAARAIEFVPDVVISVPPYNADDDPETEANESRSNAFAGTQFQVRFSRSGGPASGCSATSVTYTVQPNGAVTADAPTLIDRPTATADRCIYSVTFPDPVTPSAGPDLAIQAGASTAVNGGSQAVRASYLTAADSTFEPNDNVSITLEMIDTDRNSVHDLSGQRIQLDFSRVAGSNSACTLEASESYVVADDGTAALASSADDQAADPQPISLVDRPAGQSVRCQYDVSYPASLPTAGPADPNQPAAQPEAALVLPRDVLSQIDGGTLFVLAYAKPIQPRVIPQPVPLMSVNTGVQRVPLRVSLVVPTGDFDTGDTFEVLVSVPGACGSDTFLFGGVPASAGVSYAAKATIRGEAVLLGEGTRFVNPQASYSLPPYVDAAAGSASSGSAAGGREPCSIRVTELSSPPGCSLRNVAATDPQDRSYIQTTWASGVSAFNLTATYDCPSLVEQAGRGTLELTQGWVGLSFNGPTGTTPQQLSQTLGGVLSSIWVWDPAVQNWLGWADQHGDLGLPQLTRGQTLIAYASRPATVNYLPGDLLDPAEPTGSLELAPQYNMITYNGQAPTNVPNLIRQPSPIAVIFLWHAATQSWRYHLPGRAPLANLQIDWFNTLQPGDNLFVYSVNPQTTTIPWA